MIPIVGQNVGGAILEYKLAEGSTANVWAAKLVTLERDVAVKFLATPQPSSDGALRFERGGRAMARVKSAHVPEMFGAGRSGDGTPFIVMERLVGRRLDAWAAQHGRLSLDQAARVVDHVGAALAATHAAGIVHRRVSPESIVVSGEPHDLHAKLVDFDSAESTDRSLDAPPRVHGPSASALGHESPQWFLDDQQDDRRDLAIVAYWCLTGRHPFDANGLDSSDVGEEKRFAPLSEIRAGVPTDVDAWFDRALSRDPQRAFPSAILMAQLFQLAARARPLHAAEATSQSPTLPRFLPPVRHVSHAGPKHRVRILGGVALALLGVGGMILMPCGGPGTPAEAAMASLAPSETDASSGSPRRPEPSPTPPSASSEPAEDSVLPPVSSSLAVSGGASFVAPQSHAYRAASSHGLEPGAQPTPAVADPASWSPTDELGEPGERSSQR